jgi:hypothetical protein
MKMLFVLLVVSTLALAGLIAVNLVLVNQNYMSNCIIQEVLNKYSRIEAIEICENGVKQLTFIQLLLNK